VREGGGLPRESTHGQTCDHDGSRDTDEDVGQQDQAGSDGIPWVLLMSRRGHALSIGPSAAVLAQWLGSTREVNSYYDRYPWASTRAVRWAEGPGWTLRTSTTWSSSGS
jgi:hypothetical protein